MNVFLTGWFLMNRFFLICCLLTALSFLCIAAELQETGKQTEEEKIVEKIAIPQPQLIHLEAVVAR